MLKKKTAANKAVESAAQSAAARLAEQLDGNRAGPSDGGVSEVPDEQKTTEELVSKAQAVHGDTTRTAQNALRVRWGFWTMHGSCTTTLQVTPDCSAPCTAAAVTACFQQERMGASTELFSAQVLVLTAALNTFAESGRDEADEECDTDRAGPPEQEATPYRWENDGGARQRAGVAWVGDIGGALSESWATAGCSQRVSILDENKLLLGSLECSGVAGSEDSTLSWLPWSTGAGRTVSGPPC